ncbi:hypothetical protein Tco_0553252 [Tanacetum coccineum]
MRTRSQSRNSNRQQQQDNPTFVEPFNLVELIENQAPLVVTMADNRTMAQLLEAPTEGYEDAIVVPEITTDNFELKHGLLTLRFDETFYEAWDRFNDLLRACPHHGFSELHQLDTFYNALNSNDQDSLNSTAGGNFLDKMPRDCLRIIESKSKVRNSRNKPVVAKVSTGTSTPGISSEVAELKDMVKALLLDKKNQSPAPTPVKAVEESCVTCGGAHSYQTCPATTGNVVQPPAYQAPAYQAPAPQNQGVSKEDFQANVKANDDVMRNMQTQGITTRSGVAYKGPMIHTTSSPKVVERKPEVTKDTMPPTNNGSTERHPNLWCPYCHIIESISEPVKCSS